MADAPAEPACKKRYPSEVCGEPGCDKQARSGDRWQGDGYRCVTHGGGTQCSHVDPESGRCPKAANYYTGIRGERFCAAHSKGWYADGRILKKPPVDEYYDPDLYEWIKRLKRDAHLREKHLLKIWARQGDQCADPMRACYEVENGKATARCPWVKLGQRPSLEQVQLDHIKPLWAGGSNDPSNLQAVCACCHALKTSWDLVEKAASAVSAAPAGDHPYLCTESLDL